MILLIDTTRFGEIRVGVYSTRLRVVKRRVDGHVRGQLLNVIDGLVHALGVNVRQCTGIVVASGPGPFSALRSAAAVANAMAYALGIPVVGVRGSLSMRELHDRGSMKLRRVGIGVPVVPFYGRPPNITKAKRR